MKTISIVIPAWNEEKTIAKLIEIVKGLEFNDLEKEIICINDASTDKTLQILETIEKENTIKLIQNEKNLGKSQSVKRGILQSTGDILVVQDADLELNPQELIPMANMIQNDRYGIVLGNRYDKKVINKVSVQNYWGNKFLTTFSNLFTFSRGVTVPDMEVCYKMMKGSIWRELAAKLESTTTIGIEPEIIARIARYKSKNKKLRIGYYPISYFPRSIAGGKKTRYLRDGIKAVWEIVKYNLFAK